MDIVRWALIGALVSASTTACVARYEEQEPDEASSDTLIGREASPGEEESGPVGEPIVIEDPPAPGDYRYLLLEDLSQRGASVGRDPSGPGADIDAISVTVDGVEHFTTEVVAYDATQAADPERALGPPDSRCDPDLLESSVVSLGGGGGYIVVRFDVDFTSGDVVSFYEIGPTRCSHQPTWLDEDVRVSFSASSNLAEFSEVGTFCLGVTSIPVP